MLDIAVTALGDIGPDELELADKIAQDVAFELQQLGLRGVNFTVSIRRYVEEEDS
jgi:hypothetical protein